MSEKPTLNERLRARIYGLASRGADICVRFQPRPHDDGGLAQSCAVCGYYADVHLLRDALNDLEARSASASVTIIERLNRQPHRPPCPRFYEGRETAECICWIGSAIEFIEAGADVASSPPPSASVELPEDRAMVSDYSDPEQLAGRIAKALPHLSARSVEEVARLIEAECQRSSASGEGERQDDAENAAQKEIAFWERKVHAAESSLSALRSALTALQAEIAQHCASFFWNDVDIGLLHCDWRDRIEAALASASSGDAGTGVEAFYCAHCEITMRNCPICGKREWRVGDLDAELAASPKAGPA